MTKERNFKQLYQILVSGSTNSTIERAKSDNLFLEETAERVLNDYSSFIQKKEKVKVGDLCWRIIDAIPFSKKLQTDLKLLLMWFGYRNYFRDTEQGIVWLTIKEAE